eukprot:TRINITY_DN56_c0_g1_i7.p4 TRINITY_DN56_c0_g1~~TRINITY_DN56_c0_g1_i7.p4  ORF type:complete len:104 (-),score=3.99 TRINITY_DN56_c0_g1_i7:67-378(-)
MCIRDRYIGIGWFAIFAIYPMAQVLALSALILLVLGGVMYTIGGVIYMVLLNHLGHVTQHNLNAIPTTAHIVTAKNKLIPILPCNATKQNGAYDPAININIIE